MRQRALVALAGSNEDAHLLSYARLLADCGLLREMRFVHVAPAHLEPSQAADLNEAVAAEVERHFGAPDGPLIASCHVERGDRLDTLLERAHEWRSDLVLLGHRRVRSGQRSLARRLAMISSCSVWMVPQDAPVRLRRILAPVDLSEHAADGLAMAVDVARAAGVEECLALHVAFDESLDRSEAHRRTYVAQQTQACERFLREVDTSGVPFEWICEQGARPAQTILRVAEARQMDLIVMSTRGRSRAASILLGSVTTQVMISTGIPILAVKHFGAMLGLFNALKTSQFWNRKNPKFN